MRWSCGLRLVALVIRAGHAGELERADVAGAHDVRPGAEVNEIAVLEIGDLLALGNGFEVANLELARIARTLGQAAEPPALANPSCACSRVTTIFSKTWFALISFFISASICLEILRRDAVRQIHVVIKTVLDRRPGGELRVRPQPQDGGGQHMRGGMADAFQLGHLRAVVQSFALRVQVAVLVQQTWTEI